jgi:hypothetical protein
LVDGAARHFLILGRIAHDKVCEHIHEDGELCRGEGNGFYDCSRGSGWFVCSPRSQ